MSHKSHKTVSVALQGGGSHCAFAWGVLDALLADGRLKFDGLSGTSGGAVNAVALADGLARGGAEAARESLSSFWQRLDSENLAVAEADEFLDAAVALFKPWLAAMPSPMKEAADYFSMSNPWAIVPEFLVGVSPYKVNPFPLNPIIEKLEAVFDFEMLRQTESPKLFVSATSVHTGESRVFYPHEIDGRVLTASVCMPRLFRAVEIEDHAYWDGGYTANPMLWPLIRETEAHDVVLVKIVPFHASGVPETPHEIIGRLHQIVFNSSLRQELREIHFINRLLREKRLDPKRYKIRHVHCIDGTDYIGKLPAGSMYDINPSLIRELRDAGREIAQAWLSTHYKDIGRRSTYEPDEPRY